MKPKSNCFVDKYCEYYSIEQIKNKNNFVTLKKDNKIIGSYANNSKYIKFNKTICKKSDLISFILHDVKAHNTGI